MEPSESNPSTSSDDLLTYQPSGLTPSLLGSDYLTKEDEDLFDMVEYTTNDITDTVPHGIEFLMSDRDYHQTTSEFPDVEEFSSLQYGPPSNVNTMITDSIPPQDNLIIPSDIQSHASGFMEISGEKVLHKTSPEGKIVNISHIVKNKKDNYEFYTNLYYNNMLEIRSIHPEVIESGAIYLFTGDPTTKKVENGSFKQNYAKPFTVNGDKWIRRGLATGEPLEFKAWTFELLGKHKSQKHVPLSEKRTIYHYYYYGKGAGVIRTRTESHKKRKTISSPPLPSSFPTLSPVISSYESSPQPITPLTVPTPTTTLPTNSSTTSSIIAEHDGVVYIGNQNFNTNEIRMHVYGKVIAEGGCFTRSDKRTKESIELITDEIVNQIFKLKTYQYNYKSDVDKNVRYGFMAQDIEKHLSNLVTRDEDDMLAVDMNGLIPLMVKAIQNLNNKISEVEKLLEGLSLAKDSSIVTKAVSDAFSDPAFAEAFDSMDEILTESNIDTTPEIEKSSVSVDKNNNNDDNKDDKVLIDLNSEEAQRILGLVVDHFSRRSSPIYARGYAKHSNIDLPILNSIFYQLKDKMFTKIDKGRYCVWDMINKPDLTPLKKEKDLQVDVSQEPPTSEGNEETLALAELSLVEQDPKKTKQIPTVDISTIDFVGHMNKGTLHWVKLPELKTFLRKEGLKVSGSKDELVSRVTQVLQAKLNADSTNNINK